MCRRVQSDDGRTHINGIANVRNKGGQKGNRNAAGGNQSAPPGNNNAEKYGFFRKYLPEETVSIIEEMPKDPLDVLWDQIQIAYAAIIRAQQIMYKVIKAIDTGRGKAR